MTNLPTRTELTEQQNTSTWQGRYGDFRDFVEQISGCKTADVLTISSGNITPTTGIVLADTESSAATDDLTNILQTNLPDGFLIYLSAYVTGRNIVVKHNSGGVGTIVLSGEVDKTLTYKDFIILRRSGTAWIEQGLFAYKANKLYSDSTEYLEWDGTDLYVSIG